jgi:hypothetical protein
MVSVEGGKVGTGALIAPGFPGLAYIGGMAPFEGCRTTLPGGGRSGPWLASANNINEGYRGLQ